LKLENILVKKAAVRFEQLQKRMCVMPAINIANGTIDEISRDRGNTLATVSYLGGWGRRQTEQTIRLAVGPRTLILNENGNPVPANALRVGMTVNASVSSAMTRSIPPQTTAFEVRML